MNHEIHLPFELQNENEQKNEPKRALNSHHTEPHGRTVSHFTFTCQRLIREKKMSTQRNN